MISNNTPNENINDLELKNQQLNSEILRLNNELNIEKNNSILLSQRIKELEKIINIKSKEKSNENQNININMINKEKNLINELNEKLKNLNNRLNRSINKDKINELYEEIRIKDKIISSFPVKLSESEKLLSVIFVSVDQKIHYSTICKNTDKFSKIENLLYDAYHEYIKTENNFFVNGNKVNKYKSLENNKIKNNDIIILKKIE